jgi:hypothetical protein
MVAAGCELRARVPRTEVRAITFAGVFIRVAARVRGSCERKSRLWFEYW